MTTAMPKQELERRCKEAQDIVREAGNLARAAFLDRESLSISTKGTQDWATNADLEVEELIRRRLAISFPGEAILGEEQGHSGSVVNQDTWVIDPIDGTTCFLLGLPQWCVVLTYVIDSKPVVATIYHAMQDEMFSATLGGGTYVNGVSVRVAESTSVTDGLIAVGAAQVADPEKSAQFIAELVGSGGMYVRVGACALALCYVASGRLMAAYEPWVCPWDDLAGMLLVQEAGGVTNPYSETIVADKRRPVLVACPGIWSAVEPLLRTA
jgi:myo-inositol-1(or 4)-monophosphatase